MDGLATFSRLAGYASMGCWLGAQFPQILKNIQTQSSEGLALPFLANWFAGDMSNLIGCILTHQLPFQTYLAMYFCFVDVILLTQYLYYRSDKPTAAPYGYTRIRVPSTFGRRLSSENFRTLSTVAANVAAGAALAAQQETQDSQYTRSWRQGRSIDQLREDSGSRISRDVVGNEGEFDEAALSALADSFHSEGGRTNRRKRVSWSTERYGRSGSVGRTPTTPVPPSLRITTQRDFGTLARGRSNRRNGESDIEEAEDSRTVRTHGTSSRASRRGASMVFLGVWALFSFGTLARNGSGTPFDGIANVGRVLVSKTTNAPTAAPAASVASGDIASALGVLLDDNVRPSKTRILGRIFAWLCTTFYLTSRLPQIWKNFVRKSVEGLSMFLFIFAFLGNTFYVMSILTAPDMRLPPPANQVFVRESLPYLLGSAGTLLFDVSIVSQSLIYRPKLLRNRGRQSSTHRRTVSEEETGLLSGDALASQDEGLGHTKSRTSSS